MACPRFVGSINDVKSGSASHDPVQFRLLCPATGSAPRLKIPGGNCNG